MMPSMLNQQKTRKAFSGKLQLQKSKTTTEKSEMENEKRNLDDLNLCEQRVPTKAVSEEIVASEAVQQVGMDDDRSNELGQREMKTKNKRTCRTLIEAAIDANFDKEHKSVKRILTT